MTIKKPLGLILMLTSVLFVGESAHSQTEVQFVPRSGFWDDGKLVNSAFLKLECTESFSSLLSPIQKEQIEGLHEEFNLITREAYERVTVDPQSNALAIAEQKRIELAPKFLERMEVVVGGDVWPLLVLEINNDIATHYEDSSGLTIPAIIEGLKLNPKQVAEFQDLKKKLDSAIEKQSTKLKNELKSLLEQHFSNIKLELDLPQNKQFLTWFGELNLFETLSLTDQYASIVNEVSEQGESGSIAGIVMAETADGFREKGARLPIADRREVEIDLLLYRILTMDNIESKLELSSDQLELVKKELEGDDIRLVLRNRRTQRLLAILADKWELPRWLDKILLDHQKEWFRQFEFQVYCLAYADSFGILHSDVSKALRLMPTQKTRIEHLARDYSSKVRDLSFETGRSIEKERQEMRYKMLKSLTPEQLHQYALWFGPTKVEPR